LVIWGRAQDFRAGASYPGRSLNRLSTSDGESKKKVIAPVWSVNLFLCSFLLPSCVCKEGSYARSARANSFGPLRKKPPEQNRSRRTTQQPKKVLSDGGISEFHEGSAAEASAAEICSDGCISVCLLSRAQWRSWPRTLGACHIVVCMQLCGDAYVQNPGCSLRRWQTHVRIG